MKLRKGSTTSTRPAPVVPEDIAPIIRCAAAKCHSALRLATREQLIDAHRWCDRNGGHGTRRRFIAKELQKRELNAATEAEMKR